MTTFIILSLCLAVSATPKPTKYPKGKGAFSKKKDRGAKGHASPDSEVSPSESSDSEKNDSAPAPAASPSIPSATTTTTSEPVLKTPKAERSNMAPPLRIAVYDLELQDVPKSLGVITTDSLVSEVRKLQRVNVIGMNEIRDMLNFEAQKQLAGCSESGDSCLAEVASALGVDELVTGKLTKLGDETVVVMRRIDQRQSTVKATYEQRVKTTKGNEVLASVGPSIEQLFSTHPIKEGVVRGVAKEVGLMLNPPPVPVAATASVIGVAAASAIVGGIFGMLALSSQNEYNTLAATSVNTPQPGKPLKDIENTAQQRALIANIGFGAAGGTAVVAAVLALFTDWKNYRAELQKMEARK